MSPIAVKLDENLGRTHADALRRAGYDALRVRDQGLSGAADDVVWQHVCTEGRLLITLDLDFSDVRRFVPGTHPGILILRPRARGRDAVLDMLSRVIRERDLERIGGTLAVADERRTRVRKPSSSNGQADWPLEDDG